MHAAAPSPIPDMALGYGVPAEDELTEASPAVGPASSALREEVSRAIGYGAAPEWNAARDDELAEGADASLAAPASSALREEVSRAVGYGAAPDSTAHRSSCRRSASPGSPSSTRSTR